MTACASSRPLRSATRRLGRRRSSRFRCGMGLTCVSCGRSAAPGPPRASPTARRPAVRTPCPTRRSRATSAHSCTRRRYAGGGRPAGTTAWRARLGPARVTPRNSPTRNGLRRPDPSALKPGVRRPAPTAPKDAVRQPRRHGPPARRPRPNRRPLRRLQSDRSAGSRHDSAQPGRAGVPTWELRPLAPTNCMAPEGGPWPHLPPSAAEAPTTAHRLVRATTPPSPGAREFPRGNCNPSRRRKAPRPRATDHLTARRAGEEVAGLPIDRERASPSRRARPRRPARPARTNDCRRRRHRGARRDVGRHQTRGGHRQPDSRRAPRWRPRHRPAHRPDRARGHVRPARRKDPVGGKRPRVVAGAGGPRRTGFGASNLWCMVAPRENVRRRGNDAQNLAPSQHRLAVHVRDVRKRRPFAASAIERELAVREPADLTHSSRQRPADATNAGRPAFTPALHQPLPIDSAADPAKVVTAQPVAGLSLADGADLKARMRNTQATCPDWIQQLEAVLAKWPRETSAAQTGARHANRTTVAPRSPDHLPGAGRRWRPVELVGNLNGFPQAPQARPRPGPGAPFAPGGRRGRPIAGPTIAAHASGSATPAVRPLVR